MVLKVTSREKSAISERQLRLGIFKWLKRLQERY